MCSIIECMNKNPAKLYIQSHDSMASRTTLTSTIRIALDILAPGTNINTFPYSSLNYSMAYDLRDAIVKKGYSPKTVNSYMSALKGVAKFSWLEKLIDIDTYSRIKEVNGFKGSRIPKGRAPKIDELVQIIDHCLKQDGPLGMRNAALVAAVYGAGLRRTEASNLNVEDFNACSATITVTGKGNKQRVNPITKRIVDILSCWVEEMGDNKGPMFVRVIKGGKITGDRISSQTVYDTVKKLQRECGLKSLTPHDLRRAFCTHLLENGEDIFVVQDLMDHSSVNTTKVYDKRDQKAKTAAVQALPL